MRLRLILRATIFLAVITMLFLAACKVETKTETLPASEGGGKKVDISIKPATKEEVKAVTKAAVAATTEAAASVGRGVERAVTITSETIRGQ